MQKLEISLNRLDDVCDHSESMVKLYQRIAHLEKTFSGQLQLARQRKLSKPQAEQLLNKYESVLEQMADELDMFEGSGMNIQQVLKPYEKVVALFQTLDQYTQGAQA